MLFRSLGTGCAKCKTTYQTIEKVISENNLEDVKQMCIRDRSLRGTRTVTGFPSFVFLGMYSMASLTTFSSVSYTHLILVIELSALSGFMVHPVEYEMSMIIWFELSVTDLEALFVFRFRLRCV